METHVTSVSSKFTMTNDDQPMELAEFSSRTNTKILIRLVSVVFNTSKV